MAPFGAFWQALRNAFPIALPAATHVAAFLIRVGAVAIFQAYKSTRPAGASFKNNLSDAIKGGTASRETRYLPGEPRVGRGRGRGGNMRNARGGAGKVLRNSTTDTPNQDPTDDQPAPSSKSISNPSSPHEGFFHPPPAPADADWNRAPTLCSDDKQCQNGRCPNYHHGANTSPKIEITVDQWCKFENRCFSKHCPRWHPSPNSPYH